MLSTIQKIRSLSLLAAGMTAFALSSQARADSTAPCNSTGDPNTLECGEESIAFDYSTAVGDHAVAGASALISLGPIFGYSPPADSGATALGTYAYAVGENSLAVGNEAGVGILTFPGSGAVSFSGVSGGTAIGGQSLVMASNGTAVGYRSTIEGDGSNGTAIGVASIVQATDGTAIGFGANVLDEMIGDSVLTTTEPAVGSLGGTSIGTFSMAYGFDNVAIGSYATVGLHNNFDVYVGSTAVGASSNVTADQSVALGAHSSATAENSVAIGYGSVADQANTVSVGSAGAERRIVNVAAGTAATDAVNVGQLNAVTGNVAAVQTTVATHTTQIATLNSTTAMHTTQIGALQAGQESLEMDIDALFDLRGRDRRDMKQGVAAAMSMAQAPMPSGPGRVSYAVNGAAFRGEYAVGASLNYRLNTQSPMAVSVGASFAGNKNNGFRLGVAGEF